MCALIHKMRIIVDAFMTLLDNKGAMLFTVRGFGHAFFYWEARSYEAVLF